MLDIGMNIVPDAGTRPVRFGEIGVGYWGGNLVRNLVQMPATEMCLVADLDRDRKYR